MERVLSIKSTHSWVSESKDRAARPPPPSIWQKNCSGTLSSRFANGQGLAGISQSAIPRGERLPCVTGVVEFTADFDRLA